MRARLLILGLAATALRLLGGPVAAQQEEYKTCGESGTDVQVGHWIRGKVTEGTQPKLEEANCVTPPSNDYAQERDSPAILKDGGAYAWRQFLYLASKGEDDRYRLMKFGQSDLLMPVQGNPPDWEQASKQGLTGGPTGKHGGITGVQQAGTMVPVVDQNGRWLHYSVAVNRAEWQYVTGRSESNRVPLYTSDGYNKKICQAVLEQQGAADPAIDPKHLEPDMVAYVDCVSGLRCVSAKSDSSCIAVDAKNLAVTLPGTSIELKASWRVLETCDLPDSPRRKCKPDNRSKYVTINTTVNPYGPGPLYKEMKVILGLVGLHIISKTDQQPDWVWATFEHKGNARDCRTDPLRPPMNMFCLPESLPLLAWAEQPVDPFTAPAGPLTGADTLVGLAHKHQKEKKAVVREGKLHCVADPAAYKNARPRLYQPRRHGTRPMKLTPTKVCRLDPIALAVEELNEQIHERLAREINLMNYHLVGVFWFDKDCREGDSCATLGTQTLANTTAETYAQNLTCTTCHGMNQANPNPFNSNYIAAGIADRSFIFNRIRQPGRATPDGK